MAANSTHPDYLPSPDGLRRAGAAVGGTHADYGLSLPAWSRARDVLAGEDAVKAAGERYLPRLDSQSDEEYSAYKARASFFGATARTLEEYLDLVFRRGPAFALGATAGRPAEALERFVGDLPVGVERTNIVLTRSLCGG